MMMPTCRTLRAMAALSQYRTAFRCHRSASRHVVSARTTPIWAVAGLAADDYGFFDCVVVSREGLVAIETNRYSVPAHLMGRALTARNSRRAN